MLWCLILILFPVAVASDSLATYGAIEMCFDWLIDWSEVLGRGLGLEACVLDSITAYLKNELFASATHMMLHYIVSMRPC